MKQFTVKAKNLEFVVPAKDWYNAIQVAYEKYVEEKKSTELISYMEFRNYCKVALVEENQG